MVMTALSQRASEKSYSRLLPESSGAFRKRLFKGLAAVSPAAATLAFPAPSLWPLALVCLVPVLLVLSRTESRKQAAFLGWTGGAAFFLTTHYWMTHKTHVFQPFIAAMFGATWLPWALAARATLGRGRVYRALCLVPSFWVLAEAGRSWDRLGGPWALLGATQWNSLWGLEIASWGGVWFVGWVVVAVNTAIAASVLFARQRSFESWGGRELPSSGAVTTCLLSLAVAIAAAWIVASTRRPPEYARVLRIAGVQPGPIGPAEQRFTVAEAMTLTLQKGYDLVVWGESSLGEDPFLHDIYMQRLQALASDTGAPLLVNVDARSRTGSIYKTSLLVDADGPKFRYDKRRLVPFGEYVPARPLMGWVSWFTDAAREDRGRGQHDVVMQLSKAGVSVAPLICFESAFPDMSRSLAQKGSDVIVVQSGNTTFQRSWLPRQHASLAAIRAAETGRPVIHATLSGVSAAFDAYGAQLAYVSTEYEGTWSVDIPLFQRDTVYSIAGDWVVWASILLSAVVGGLWVLANPRRGSSE
ncbi:MAG: apolipoprotein N-acyltransferase [Acidimicrobiia bacterium]